MRVSTPRRSSAISVRAPRDSLAKSARPTGHRARLRSAYPRLAPRRRFHTGARSSAAGRRAWSRISRSSRTARTALWEAPPPPSRTSVRSRESRESASARALAPWMKGASPSDSAASGRGGLRLPELPRQEAQAHQHQLRSDEPRQPPERALHEAVRVQPDTQHVDAEPGEAGDDVAEDGHRHDALLADVAAPAR